MGTGQAAENDGVVEGHVVLFVRGTHGTCRERSRCIVNTAELALALAWVSERVRCLPARGWPAGESQTPRDRRKQANAAWVRPFSATTFPLGDEITGNECASTTKTNSVEARL